MISNIYELHKYDVILTYNLTKNKKLKYQFFLFYQQLYNIKIYIKFLTVKINTKML